LDKVYKKTYIKKDTILGFSLVELLIVIAIIGVLAIVAINVFVGVLQNSKDKSDMHQAKNIEKAIRMLISDTSISDIIARKDELLIKSSHYSSDQYTPIDISNSYEGTKNLIVALQNPIYVKSPETGVIKEFGPYLTNPLGNNTASYDSYQPQWSKIKGTGNYTGYLLEIVTATNNVRGIPVKGMQNIVPTSFETEQSPGILIVN
jgi:type IV pilus assembly protein PilA